MKGYRGSNNSLCAFKDCGGNKVTDTMLKFTARGPAVYLISLISVLLGDVRSRCRNMINFSAFPPAVPMKRFR